MNKRQADYLRPRKTHFFHRKNHRFYESMDSADLKELFKAKKITDEVGIATHEAHGMGSYILTECGNQWFSINDDPMARDGVICPRCGRKVSVDLGMYLAESAQYSLRESVLRI